MLEFRRYKELVTLATGAFDRFSAEKELMENQNIEFNVE
jgi:hypothetical protein